MDLNDINLKLKRIRLEAEEREAERVADSLNLPFLNSSALSVQLEALKLIPEGAAKKAKIAAIQIQDKNILVIGENPETAEAKSEIEQLRANGYKVGVAVVPSSVLPNIWERYKEIIESRPEITSEIAISGEVFDSLKGQITNLQNVRLFCGQFNEKPVTEILSFVFASSVIIEASDIHFEPAKDKVHLRFRVDGILNDLCSFSYETYKQVLNRIKLLAGLKINIKDVPQDGRFTIKINGQDIEVRVAVSPSEFGEVIVMRVLNPKTIALALSDLGLRLDDEELVLKEIKRPNGMILVTGPTGSGKTTTLYAFLKKIASSESKTITIEDPIEYQLENVEQTQVDSKKGYTFAVGLRSILRQDPDIILVGEIRDGETADIAIQASLTGHLVLSTLHTNNAVGAIPRLVDLGIKASIIAPALSLVAAQRLVRRLCSYCKKGVEISDELGLKIEVFKSKLPQKVKPYAEIDRLYQAVGCEKCHNGYKGRIGIYEFLEMSPEIENMINKDATESAIRKIAKEKGYVEIQQDGVLKALAGITTLEEVEKVTGPLEF